MLSGNKKVIVLYSDGKYDTVEQIANDAADIELAKNNIVIKAEDEWTNITKKSIESMTMKREILI